MRQAAEDSRRIMEVLARSQRAVDCCEATIIHAEQTSHRLVELQQGLQDIGEHIEKFDVPQ